MKFLLDENVDVRLLNYLQSLGHDVTAIARDHPQSLADSEVLEVARGEHRVLITNDADFGELVFRQRLPHSGVILFRLSTEAIEVKRERLSVVLRQFRDDLTGFITVTDAQVRVGSPPR